MIEKTKGQYMRTTSAYSIFVELTVRARYSAEISTFSPMYKWSTLKLNYYAIHIWQIIKLVIASPKIQQTSEIDMSVTSTSLLHPY